MPNKILKHFLKPETSAYVFQPAADLVVEPKPPEPDPLPELDLDDLDLGPDPEDGEEDSPYPEDAPKSAGELKREDPVSFAQVQAEALLREARKDVEAYRREALETFEAELEAQREAARKEGYDEGFAAGMAEAAVEAKAKLETMAAKQIQDVKTFMEGAARARDAMLDDTREEIKDMAVAIAEKVIQVSLKNSSDIILRMVDAATDTHKRCAWAHIYVADCDVRGKAQTPPELAAALSHISERVRVIPMADDESGTLIVELPDVIMDASVSTQLGNIREVLRNTGPD